MASSSNALPLKVLLCAALLLSTAVGVSRGHCGGPDDCRGGSVAAIITGRRMLVADRSAAAAASSQLAAATATAMRVPRFTRPAAAAAAYSESKRASPGGPDPQHH